MASTPRDPLFEQRVRASFARQSMMTTLGATIVRVEPGLVVLAMPRSDRILQQHGFVHGGVISCLADSAAGYAALSLMPAGRGVLTVEFKINLLAPASHARFVATGEVRKAGRTLTVAHAEVSGEDGDGRLVPVAILTATMMAIEERAGVVD